MEMKQILIDTIKTVSGLIPFGLYPRLVKRDFTAIFYHAVSDNNMAHVQHLFPVVPVAEFMNALAYLKESYTFVSYDQLHDYVVGGTPLPLKAVHLSFDDGFAECYTVVRPILLEQQIPCAFFLTTDWLDNHMLYFRHQISLCVHHAQGLQVHDMDILLEEINQRFNVLLTDLTGFTKWITQFRTPEDQILNSVCSNLGIDVQSYLENYQPYLTNEQIQQMHAEGFTIGSHGVSHRKLGSISSEDVKAEIVESCRTIQGITGQKIVPFSFPQSAADVNRAQLANLLERYPFIGLLFDSKDMRKDNAFLINRVWAERPITPDRELLPLPEILKHAYQDAWTEGVRKVFRNRT